MRYLMLCLFFLFSTAQAVEEVDAYSTYTVPPYATEGGGAGLLNADFVAYLNSKLTGQYHFVLKAMPRERLNQTVINDPKFKGIVMFMSPIFVGDVAKTNYRWSTPLMEESNVAVSSLSKKVEYTGPDSLIGMRFSGIRGNKYAGLEEHFGKDIKREDVTSEWASLQKVMAGNSDVTVLANSMYRYLAKAHNVEGKFYVSDKAFPKYSRHVFAAKGEDKLIAAIDTVLTASKNDPAWKALVAKYSYE